MASVFVRSGGRFYARIKDRNGRWVSRRVRQQTRRDAVKVARAMEAEEEQIRVGLKAAPERGALVGPLMKRWALSLANRSADLDRGRIDLHVMPRWRAVCMVDVTLASVTAWLDDLAEGDLSAGSRRHLLGLLSRFLSWAQQRGYVERNVVRDLPPGARPRPIPPPRESIPWLKDDADVVRVMQALPAPFGAIFFVANRSGARLSEVLSLRLSDLVDIDEGAIRIRYAGESGDGWVKEAKHGPKTKYAPIPPADARVVLGPILETRRANGAHPEAFVFVDQDGDRIDRHAVCHRWSKVRKALGLPAGLNFYRATRHSAASRALASGAGVDEISASLGHADIATTARHYLHVQRRRFSSILTAGLGLAGVPGAKVIPLAGRSEVTREPAATGSQKGGEHAA